MVVSLLTHICVTRPQWVNSLYEFISQIYDILSPSKTGTRRYPLPVKSSCDIIISILVRRYLYIQMARITQKRNHLCRGYAKLSRSISFVSHCTRYNYWNWCICLLYRSRGRRKRIHYVGDLMERVMCAILISHQLLWQNMQDPVSIFQDSPLAGEPRERLLHIHSVNRYFSLLKIERRLIKQRSFLCALHVWWERS